MDEHKARELELDLEIEALARGPRVPGSGRAGDTLRKVALVLVGMGTLYGVWYFALGGRTALCNDARQEASEEWEHLRRDLNRACSAYQSDDILTRRRRASASSSSFGAGGYSDSDLAGAGYLIVWGDKYGSVEDACTAVLSARNAAAMGVNAARLSSEALAALRRAVAQHAEPMGASGGDSTDRAEVNAYQTVRSEFARLNVSRRIEEASATAEGLERCR